MVNIGTGRGTQTPPLRKPKARNLNTPKFCRASTNTGRSMVERQTLTHQAVPGLFSHHGGINVRREVC